MARPAPVTEYRMPAERALRVLDALDAEDAGVVVGGGWAVDALLGRQTREHGDLDLWVPAERLERLVRALLPLGIDRIQYWGDNRPWNFPLHDGRGTRVDLHLVERLPGGAVHYGGVVSGRELPAGALDGAGTIGGRAVRCDAPWWALQCHTGYPPRDVDRHDIDRLCRRFGLPLPEEAG
jgi:lincosamide nucleotidyltransferase A/C/D/E